MATAVIFAYEARDAGSQPPARARRSPRRQSSRSRYPDLPPPRPSVRRSRRGLPSVARPPCRRTLPGVATYRASRPLQYVATAQLVRDHARRAGQQGSPRVTDGRPPAGEPDERKAVDQNEVAGVPRSLRYWACQERLTACTIGRVASRQNAAHVALRASRADENVLRSAPSSQPHPDPSLDPLARKGSWLPAREQPGDDRRRDRHHNEDLEQVVHRYSAEQRGLAAVQRV